MELLQVGVIMSDQPLGEPITTQDDVALPSDLSTQTKVLAFFSRNFSMTGITGDNQSAGIRRRNWAIVLGVVALGVIGVWYYRRKHKRGK